MYCSACFGLFIFTKTNHEYMNEKQKMEGELMVVLDKHLERETDLCWKIVLNREALLLLPGQNFKTCLNENCNLPICRYCYQNNGKLCMPCKKMGKTVDHCNADRK
jgi:hypothetical protein